MTRKSRRELEREVRDLSGHDRDAGGVLIVYERDDGTLRDPDGEPVAGDALENANVVLQYEPKKST